MPVPQRILLLGDYSNCHRNLATGLRRLGCDVTVISNGTTWQQGERDIDISRSPGRLGGLKLWYKAKYTLHKALSGYDIVAINDPNFLSLRPARLKPLFNRLKQENGGVFLTAMSNDVPFLDMLAAPDSPLRYSEWFINGKPARMNAENPQLWNNWHNRELVDYHNYVYSNLDGAVAVLYEYWLGIERALGAENVAYGGIPVDTKALTPVELPVNPAPVKLFLGRDRTRKLQKGSDYLEYAARAVCEKYPGKAELTIVENRPYAEFLELLRGAHVVLDQIYSYTPATTALLAMAYGLNVVSGAEDDFYNFIGETSNRPIINAPLEEAQIVDCLEKIVLQPETIAERGRMSRKFVLEHNDCELVARRFLDFWNKKLSAK
ncbi:MAG: hypothetical protein K2I69_01495 [Muribaculaceae bacterium]|nr:hypothetical protein [Muribaculaceae bacterium]